MSERPAPSVPPGDASTHQPTVLNQPTNQSTNQPTNVNPPSISMNSSNSSTSSSTNQPTPSLSQLKQQIVRELLILHQCYSRLNHDRGEPHRFMSFVHSLFALLPPELQLTEAEALAVDEFVSPTSSPYTPVASITFMQNLPTVDVSRCPELSCEDCPVCQEPFSSQSTLTQRRISPMPQSINQPISQSFIQPVSQSTNQPINPSPSQDPRVIELPCEHIFHYQCVATWMSTHNTCPCCRFKLPTDNTRYNETVIRRQPEPVKRNRALKRKASEITSTNHESPIPAKRSINQSINQCAPGSRCALSTHGLPCLLPINQSTHQSVIEHLSCGHSFHSQCLRTALALLGVATLQPDIGPCPLCCLHSASPDSTARLQRMTLPFITSHQNISQLTNQSSSQSNNQSREPSPSPVRYSRPQH